MSCVGAGELSPMNPFTAPQHESPPPANDSGSRLHIMLGATEVAGGCLVMAVAWFDGQRPRGHYVFAPSFGFSTNPVTRKSSSISTTPN